MEHFMRSLCDMKEIYAILAEYPGEIPSIVIVQKMIAEFEGLSHLFFTTNPQSRNVMLLLQEADPETMRRNLLECLDEFKSIDRNTLEYIVGLGIPLSHRKDLYRHAVEISKSLGIVCPQILAVPAGDKELGPNAGGRVTVFDEKIIDKDVSIGDYILIRNRGRPYMVHTVAHELRHCWQAYRNCGQYFTEYHPNIDINTRKFAEQKEEIDAEAYASLYVEKYLGVPDGTALMYDTPEIPNGWEGYREKVKARMQEIIL